MAVQPGQSLAASAAIDFVAREEFDFTIAEVAAGRPLAAVAGLSFTDHNGVARHNPDRVLLQDMDRLPFVTPVYKRDLRPEDYYIGYLLHPYVSLYTGRGCRSRCTFCLWPQTVGGHRYRTRSVANVLEEAALVRELFPQVKELFFDDDTFTDDRPRAEANVPRETLKVLRDNGLRLLLVGYESGNQQILINIKKGLRVERARRFAADCKDLGITVHGTFILGLPGETKETIEETIRFARQVNPHTIQVSIAAPYPGTELHRQAVQSGWLPDGTALVGWTARGHDPIAARLATEVIGLYCPAALQGFLCQVTWLWAGVFLLLAVSLGALLATIPIVTYVPVWAATTVVLIGAGIAVSVLWLRCVLRKLGIGFRFTPVTIR
ncbi:MAG: radical SAM protein [Streptosporangiaceae bacterium]